MTQVKPSILIVEDETALVELLRYNLEAEGFEVRASLDGDEALTMVAERVPDLIVLDWMLPSVSGLEICRQLRRKPETRNVPIILLTARAEEADRMRGFESGADDYVTKPFSPRELLARVKALLRRAAPESTEEPVEIAGLRLDPKTFRVTGNGSPVELSPTEFRLLHFMMKQPDRVLSRSRLLDNVWGDHVFIEERTVDVHIRRLRLALQPTGHDRLVETVRGGGYRFLPA